MRTMRRVLAVTTLGAVVALLAAVITVNVSRPSVEDFPPLDPNMPIRLRDGSVASLSDVVSTQPARVAGSPFVPPSMPPPGNSGTTTQDESRPPETPPAAATESGPRENVAAPDPDDAPAARVHEPLFALADRHLRAGNLEEALALFRSIPEDHPDYARSQRRIGWDIMTKKRGEPHEAVTCVHRALLEAPFDPNSWQDLARVYGASLGLPMD